MDGWWAGSADCELDPDNMLGHCVSVLLVTQAVSETGSRTGRDSEIQEDICLDVTKSVYTGCLSQCGRRGIMTTQGTGDDCTG